MGAVVSRAWAPSCRHQAPTLAPLRMSQCKNIYSVPHLEQRISFPRCQGADKISKSLGLVSAWL